jgi:hypothetical protein
MGIGCDLVKEASLMNGIAVLVTIHFQFDRLVTDSTEFRNRFHGTPSGGDFPNTIRGENSEQGAFSPCPVSRHPLGYLLRINSDSRVFSPCSFGVFPGCASQALRDAPEIEWYTCGDFTKTSMLSRCSFSPGTFMAFRPRMAASLSVSAITSTERLQSQSV